MLERGRVLARLDVNLPHVVMTMGASRRRAEGRERLLEIGQGFRYLRLTVMVAADL